METTNQETKALTARDKMMEWGGVYRTLSEMETFTVPEATRTWNAPHPLKVFEEVTDRVETLQGLVLGDVGFVTNKKATQWMMLALFTGDDSLEPLNAERSILARGSTDKMHSLSIEAGVALRACFNGLSWGDKDISLKRKASANGFDNLVDALTGALYRLERDRKTNQTLQVSQALQAYQLEQARGFELLGRARGENVLSPRQFETAVADWNSPRHAEFADRNAFNLFQCVNQAVKQGQPATYGDRLNNASEWFTNVIDV